MDARPFPPPDPHPAGHIAVVGQLARDLILRVDAVPEAGGSGTVVERLELLGGKGANLAVGLHQLGAAVDLVAVAGSDDAGSWVLGLAERSGLGIASVARRGTTALLLDVVEAEGRRRLLEHVPPEALLTPDDIAAAAATLTGADTVCLQLQQPVEALLPAARLARDAGASVVLDGAVGAPARDELLGLADVVRADAHEAELLSGIRIDGRADAERAAAALLGAGPGLVALGVPAAGDLVAWPGGNVFLPFVDTAVVDPTGAGDAFLAGLVTGLRDDRPPEEAGRLAAAAASATVSRLGGRPELTGLRADVPR